MADANAALVARDSDNSPPNTSEVAENAQNGQVAEGDSGVVRPAPAPAGGGGWGIIKTLAIRMFIIYLISSFFRRSPTPPVDSTEPGKAAPPGAMAPSSNIFFKDTMLDMYVYITEDQRFDNFDNKKDLFWLEEEIAYGDWTSGIHGDGSFEKAGVIPISEKVQNNGSLWMHLYIVRAGHSPNPKDKEMYSKMYTIEKHRQLNKFKKRHYHTTVNLLTGQTDAHPDLIRLPNETTVEVLSHWHPNLTINFIDDHTPWTPGAVPAPLDEYIDFLPGTNQYRPILFFNDYWNLNSDHEPINDTMKSLNLSLTYAPMSLFKWQMYAAQGMRSRWYSFLGEDMMEESDEDQDSLKRTFLETNPYLLGITIVVSIVHSIFEFLAFKNDIQFWKNRKSLEGLSVRSVFFNMFQSAIVVLYVMDNETNFVIRVSVCIGLAIEVWKIFKVIDVRIDRENRIAGIIPRVYLAEKSTYVESETKKFDILAFKYLSWLLFPLLGGYAVYSILYLEHRGWYSWFLNMIYGFLLTFGFIMMTPQLFINYKLKSVAHLPWRMLTYKALNTFIDDLFAFVIKMPTLYRIGCFRDDIIFLIYVYQRYIYRVDPSRVNEYGTSQEMLEKLANGELTPGGDGDNVEQNAIEDSTENTEPKSQQEKKED